MRIEVKTASYQLETRRLLFLQVVVKSFLGLSSIEFNQRFPHLIGGNEGKLAFRNLAEHLQNDQNLVFLVDGFGRLEQFLSLPRRNYFRGLSPKRCLLQTVLIIEHLQQDHSQRPNVYFLIVLFLEQNLGSPVEPGSYHLALRLVLVVFREQSRGRSLHDDAVEVIQNQSLVHQDILRLYISVNQTKIMQLFDFRNQLKKEAIHQVLRQSVSV